MSSRCLLLFACVACGTNEPVHADAMPDTAFVPHRAVVVNAMVSMPITGTSTTIPLPATTAGNLLVVGVALSGAQGLTVQTITLPDNRYFTREIGLWLSACDHAFETWASWNVPAGVD